MTADPIDDTVGFIVEGLNDRLIKTVGDESFDLRQCAAVASP
ncbi:Hypothetical protein MIP_00137 [Mycobacterium intracellulare subsp. intracellulare MTCC 9506]|uniref:Uncharacterized protein n=1 Tax=Mycobacterium indicus pranii (strain DSM 45239 / MTCC 9506) TaxID=1232724 RepID=J9W5H6_MYCIP|nr:Hypothetical protein MIP_00137 [Mycobacterium intracellulare subsp. intracellulare MTCC 9506]